ncbi:penicillin acylase family protein [Amycolatopsis sp. lyj-108]|uniref:penicillin acylase family protein n=1 Tax=Amycolatopsis sp. lyj-108 TaxID=2789286 RepID=UPI00397D8399
MLLWKRIAAVGAAASLLAAGTATAAQPPDGVSRADATIRYTEYGIPHIVANDWVNLGFGQGYAAAKDNICAIADVAITTRAERSRWLGPDVPPTSGVSQASSNLASDLYFQGLNESGVLERLLSEPAPRGPYREVRELIRGYAEGVNKYLRAGEITDPACRGTGWLKPITELDVYRHSHAVGMIFGQGGVADSITASRPGAPPAGAGTEQVLGETGVGSNAIAIGSTASANGRGVSLANPHLPWQLSGTRLWQSQLSLPGKLNVSGAGIPGIPMMWLGHNETAAWSGTATDTTRTYTLFELKLVPGSPTTYLVDGKPEKMRRADVSVLSRKADGALERVVRPQWTTRYGPVTTRLGQRELPWTASSAFAIADANAGNLGMTNSMFAIARGRTAGEMIGAVRETQGLPWMNILATDDRGRVEYSQIHGVPHVTDEKAARCNTPLGKELFDSDGVAVLDGSRTACAWGRDRDALRPGVFGPSSLPNLSRPDYLANSNDSYWLFNPAEPKTGFPRIVGPVRNEQNMRTRGGFVEIADQLKKGGFTGQAMRDLMFSHRDHAAELVRADVVTMCRTMPGPAAACAALAGWDGRSDADSRGALLFDRFWSTVDRLGPSIWKVPFDVKDPVHTPNTLDTGNAAIRKALTDAVAELNAAKIPLDARYGDNHYVVRDGRKIPLGGGTAGRGVYDSLGGPWDPARGYTEFTHGGTYLHVVAFNGTGCPDTTTLLTYSQSANPKSAHHSDQTELYSRKQWVTERYCEKDILASPSLDVVRVSRR